MDGRLYSGADTVIPQRSSTRQPTIEGPSYYDLSCCKDVNLESIKSCRSLQGCVGGHAILDVGVCAWVVEERGEEGLCQKARVPGVCAH